jgi:hypothetical protein
MKYQKGKIADEKIKIIDNIDAKKYAFGPNTFH